MSFFCVTTVGMLISRVKGKDSSKKMFLMNDISNELNKGYQYFRTRRTRVHCHTFIVVVATCLQVDLKICGNLDVC